MLEEYPVTKMSEEEQIECIEEFNRKSWFVMDTNKEPIHPFIAMSVGNVGPSRESRLARTVLAGNMSEFYGDPNIPKEVWPIEANKNVNKWSILACFYK